MDEIPSTPAQASDDDAGFSAKPLLDDDSDDNVVPATPPTSSDGEDSDHGLPFVSLPTPNLPAPSDSKDETACATKEIDPAKCKARTWKRALLPHLPQCSCKPVSPHELCQVHLKNLPYGRYDNPLDPSVLAKIARALRRRQRKTTKRWYCRYFMFKQAQATWGLENVVDMTDEQYKQALDAVHDYLIRKPPYRRAWKLVPDQGPEDVTERDTPKALYSGEPRRYKNYSYRMLCYFVTQLQPGATPLSCSEKVFEEALQKTNERCHTVFRGLPAAAHYQGPQCFSERANAAKLIFDPSFMPRGPRRCTTYSDGDFLVLQCCHEGCAKWRRVDVATYDLFWNDWMQAQRDTRCEALVTREPHLCSDLHVWLREQVAEYFKPRPRVRKPRPEFRFSLQLFHSFLAASAVRQALYTAHERAFLELFLREVEHFLTTPFPQAYQLEQRHVDTDAFEAELSALVDENSITPKFCCTDLADTTCDEPCDWQVAFDTAHDFSEDSVLHASMQPVLVKAAGDEADDFVHSTQFFSFAAHEASSKTLPSEEKPTSCTVRGCDHRFPQDQQYGWSIALPGSGRVCLMHHHRFQRYTSNARKKRSYTVDGALQSLWTAEELQDDARRQCAFGDDLELLPTETNDVRTYPRQCNLAYLCQRHTPGFQTHCCRTQRSP